jgi:hypothetical protein
MILGTVHADANSEERRYRNARIVDPDRPDKVPQTIADQKNTIMKMADKRLIVAAALLYTGASEAYTQDIEDGTPASDSEAAPRGLCPVHKLPFHHVPAGVSTRTGKSYNAFWACPTRGCKEKPTQEAPDALDEPDAPGTNTPTQAPVAVPAGTQGAETPPGQEAEEKIAMVTILENVLPLPAVRLKFVRDWCAANGVPAPAFLTKIVDLSLDSLAAIVDATRTAT